MTQETRSCLALLTCSLPSTGGDLSQGILSDFAEKPQVLRLRLAPRTRQTPLRMTTLVGISTEPSCLIYAFSASAKDLRPASIAGLVRGVTGFGLFMRQVGFVDMFSACKAATFVTRDIVCFRSETAGPSTTFGAKNAPNSAQDDNSCWDFSRAKLSHICLFCFGEGPETRFNCGSHSGRYGHRVVCETGWLC